MREGQLTYMRETETVNIYERERQLTYMRERDN